MSYDLFFRSRGGPPDRAGVLEWFRGREHYKVTESQAFYENQATGVYFSFDFAEDAELPAFNVNYFRPHTFGLEAEPELGAFVRRFDLTVDDPQSDGMGEGEYSAEGFVRGWNHGNRFAHRAMISLGHVNEPLLTLPRATLEGIWRWNEGRVAYGEWLNFIEMLPCFVPTVFLFQDDQDPARVRTGVIWGEAMSIALPEVDWLIVMEAVGATPVVLPRAAFAERLAGYRAVSGDTRYTLDGQERAVGLTHQLLDYDMPPADLLPALLAAGEARRVARLHPDQVLTAELVDEACANKT
ncbi:MAG: hypothetical protein H6739_10200 [Alphaproteobacteria bacterium]|nr:hypothetical protein [Alphaproteobacteria bacterium]